MSKDISRYLHQPGKHYSSVRMQQGRVILDSDWNESERLDDEEARRVNLDLIGGKGTSNEGFQISNVSENGTYDFDIAAGSYFLGGMRFEIDHDETFREQNDWIHVPYAVEPPPDEPSGLTIPDTAELANDDRYDLVYLEGWEQPVTAVEDGELREVALGGPDTSARMRRMRRIHVAPSVDSACCDGAFSELSALLQKGRLDGDNDAPHHHDAESCELISNAGLSITLDPEGGASPCEPDVPGGFLGAENETIRIQLTAANQFIWGRDNASPLYRVKVIDGDPVRIVFETQPRDQALQPIAGQAVEILPWSASLPNGEKVAETTGWVAEVTSGYDPETDGGPSLQITIPSEQSNDWGPWLTRCAQESATDGYYYLRLWTGGMPETFTAGGPAVALQGTGLEATFDNYGIPGDYWIVAARPNTPNVLVPWSLKAGSDDEPEHYEPPMGPKRFYAPLALIHWCLDENQAVEVDVKDCRRRFGRMAQAKGCCTVTVGDGVESVGDVTTIGEALEALRGTGGTVCLLPGKYGEKLDMKGMTSVTIKGCGPRSRLVNPEGDNGYSGALGQVPEGLITICDGTNIRLESFAIEATGMHAIRIQDSSTQIVMEDLDLSLRGNPSNDVIVLGGVDVFDASRVRIEDCRIITDNPADYAPFASVYLSGSDLVVRGNRIITGTADTDPDPNQEIAIAWGGIQVAGNSKDVEISGNDVLGGFGHGITLGSITYSEINDPTNTSMIPIGQSLISSSSSYKLDLFPRNYIDPDDGVTEFTPAPTGPIAGLRIADNRISVHGGSGIGVAGFFENIGGARLSHQIVDARIENNEISYCVKGDVAAPLEGEEFFWTLGGVGLATVGNSEFFRNRIFENGTTVDTPVCGIGVLLSKGLEIADCTIVDNGGSDTRALRGGIVVKSGMQPTKTFIDTRASAPPTLTTVSVGPALRVRDNHVRQLVGKALWAGIGSDADDLKMEGPIAVHGNYFESGGDRYPEGVSDTLDSQNPETMKTLVFGYRTAVGDSSVYNRKIGSGLCVEISNLAKSLDHFDSSQAASDPIDGRVMFHDNQVHLSWTIPGGACSSVLLFGHDDVSMKGNQLTANMGNSLADPQNPTQYLDEIASGASMATRSFLLFHAIVLGRTVNASHNRFTEGRTDVAGSLLSWSFADVSASFANTPVGNHATHGVFTAPSPASLTYNRVLIAHGTGSYTTTEAEAWELVVNPT